jgi:hypothetical protein
VPGFFEAAPGRADFLRPCRREFGVKGSFISQKTKEKGILFRGKIQSYYDLQLSRVARSFRRLGGTKKQANAMKSR